MNTEHPLPDMMKVLVTDAIAEEGIRALCRFAHVDVRTGLQEDQLRTVIGDYDALIVRSQTTVSAEVIEAGNRLRVIGRAGIGIDNIDVDAATRKGVVVLNAPGSNVMAAAEHTLALMLALARNIPRANSDLKSGKWQRENLIGTELRNKTLGIIGIGQVGSEVARRARCFEMRIIAHDAFVSADHAANLEVELVSLDELLREADFVTLHVPLTRTTRRLIGDRELAQLKPTARIINCARGGLVDEEAVVRAIRQGKLAGAAFDVFAREPLTESPLFEEERVIVTPHLAASTVEAQSNVARDVAEEVLGVLQGRYSKYAVNAPQVAAELVPFMRLAADIGSLASQLMEGQVTAIRVTFCGGLANYDCSPVKAALVSGLLQQVSEEQVNVVNVGFIVSQRGLRITEEKEAVCQNYSNLLTLTVDTNAGTTTVSGALRDRENHIVRVDDFGMDIVPAEGYLLFCDHADQPGLVGAVGNVIGRAGGNIGSMHLSRLQPGGRALMILSLDQSPGEEQIEELLALPGVHTVRAVKL